GQFPTCSAQGQEEVKPSQGRPEHRLQGHRDPAEVHLRAREDSRPPGDRAVCSGAAQGRHRHQECSRGCAVAVRLDGPL
ncbi:MAG: SSU ribosomal protein S18p @ SSU ribosomal protein S18p, zinc-independent, partial [uncultured Propionibacteriaceae bacterium]